MTCAEAVSLIPLYLDGELDGPLNEAKAGELGMHLQTCPTCARELAQQTVLDARLREGVLAEPVDSGAVECRVMRHIEAERKPLGWSFVAAGLAAALVMSIAGYRSLAPRVTDAVFAAAARDHHMEIVDGQPRRWRTDLASVSELASRQGISISAIPALAPAGYHFQEGKLCRLDGQLFLHLVYADSSGAHNVSVFLDHPEKASIQPIYAASFGAEHVAGFAKGPVTAMVVTGQSEDAALRFARFAASAI